MHWNGFEEDHAKLRHQVAWTGPSPQDNFITYGLLWTPDGYRMYRDGIQVFHSTEALSYAPHDLILDQFQGGNIAGAVPSGGYGDLATSPNKMVIDYVKVWQRPIAEIPDRTVPANTPVAIPFPATEYFSTSTSATIGGAGSPRPEGLQVSVAGNSNTALVPDDRIAISGDEPSDPDGGLANPGFESGTASWNPSGTAPPTTWTTRKHSGNSSMRLTQPGGRIEQDISGLRPNTTYVVGGFYNLELGFADTHSRNPDWTVTATPDGQLTWISDNGAGNHSGNGKPDVDEMETLTDPGDAAAEFDLGIVDTDASRSGSQEVRTTKNRNGWTEAPDWWAPRNDDWTEESVTFTTGPDTTQVTFFVDNVVAPGEGPNGDADLSVDDIYVRPLTPPLRTVTLRPTDDAAGSTTISLAAWVDVDNDGSRSTSETLGTEAVTFTKGSTFTNGDSSRSHWAKVGKCSITRQQPR